MNEYVIIDICIFFYFYYTNRSRGLYINNVKKYILNYNTRTGSFISFIIRYETKIIFVLIM